MKLAARIRSLRRKPQRLRRRARKTALLLESLEPRLMLASDLSDVISVGRTLSAWSTQDVQGNTLDITYTVYNQQAAAVTDVVLKTTLEAGVGFQLSSLIPDFQSGQEFEWNFGTLEPFESASVSVTVSLGSSGVLQLDTGAFALGTFDTMVVDDAANPATLRTDTIDPAQLATAPDANPNDPFIQAVAAELNQDPFEIFEFVRDDIGFESYLGSLRGSRGTLWSSAGNSLDQASLMIALLRASGVEAQYVQGTLTDELAQDLIESMFPNQAHIVGMVEPGSPVADPMDDPSLIAEAKTHFWVEFDDGTGNFTANPSFANAVLDQSFAPVDATFTETPEALRHHVSVRLDRELTLPAAGLFSGGSSQFVETALEATFTTAELVGRHLSIGHFVNRDVKSFLSTLITHTYSPYLLIGETDRDITDDELIRGEDFQEQITDFPLGSQLLTGLFLEIDVADTQGAVETFRRTIVDRIGIDIRQNGGSPDINIDETTPPAVTDVDIVTITALPGLQFPGAVASQADRVAGPQAALDALPTDGIPDQAPFTTEQSAVLAEALQLMRLVVIGVNETKASAYAASSDESLRQLELGYLTQAYYDSPRIILSETSTGDGTLSTSLDLRKNDVRSIAFPGQLAGIPLMFEIMRGMMDSTIEGEVVSSITGQQAISIDTVFAATGAGNQLVTITTDNLLELQGLALSEAAKIRISQAVLNGKGVTTPSAMVMIDGRETVGWLETDLITGETISVFEDGGHLAIAEYAAIINHVLTSPLNLAVTAFIGGVQGYGLSQLQFAGEFIGDLFALGSVETAAKSAKAKVAKNLIEEYGKQVLGLAKTQVTSYVNGVLGAPDKTTKCFAGILAGGGIENVSVISIGKCVENEIKTFFKGKTGLSALEKSYKGGVLVGMAAGLAFLTYNFPGDPPVFPYLSVPLSDLPAPIAPNTVPGVDISVEREPLFFYPYNGVQLPSVFNTIIQNTGPQSDTFALMVSGLPAGFEAVLSQPQVTLQPGHTGLVGLTIRPSDSSTPLPPPGTEIPFTVTATNISIGSVSDAAQASFTLGEIHAIRLIAEEPLLVTSPGTPVQTSFSIAAVGNVPENVAVTIDVPSGMTATAIAPVNLNVGDVETRTITFTPDPGTPLDSTFVATIVADLGSSLFDELGLSIEVAAPGVRPAQAAAVAAAGLGLDDLASRLDDLANLMTQIVKDPGDPTVKAQAVVNLTSVINQSAEEPILATALELNDSIFPPIFDALDGLESAETVQECLDAVNEVGSALNEFADAIQAVARHHASLLLLPNAIVAQPQVPQNFQLVMQNLGTQTTTYDLSVAGVPSGVVSQFSDSQVTLAPNERFVATLTLTQTDNEELLAFPFRVDVTAVGVTPEVRRSAAGSLQVRREVVSIPQVTADRPFVDPGETVNIAARILNSVNRQQEVLVSFTIRNPSDQIVFASPAVRTQLTVQTTFDDIDLGPLDTTGFGLGQHLIEVAITDVNGNPVLGADTTGRGSLLIGPPVSAALTVDPQVFLAGTRTTSNTLQIRAEAQIGDPFSMVAQLPLSEFSNDVLHGLEINDDALYVFGGQVVHVVDISEPRLPEHLEREGRPAFQGIVDGDRLIVTSTSLGGVQTPFAQNSTLHYYDIGGNFGPSNPLDLLPPVDSVNFNYNFAGKPVVNGNTAFVPVGKIVYNTANNDVFAQPGTVVSFDISNPFDIQVSDFLFNTNGQNIDPPTNVGGGNFFIFDIELPEPNTLYAATTTATGTTTELDEFGQPAVGRLLVVDVSDPANINSDPPNDSKVITELQIPGTTLIQRITIQDDTAYIVATQGGWRDFFADVGDIGPTGNLVLATVDISNPANPALIHSEVINRAARGAGELVPIGDGRFVMFSFGATTDTPQFLVIDASNPGDLIVESQFEAPGQVEGYGSDGDFLYATGAFGLVVYQIDGGGDIPVTARVRIPTNTGVEVVAGSFNTPPDSVVSGSEFNTLQWDVLLDENNLFPTFTWDTQVTDLQGGEARAVTLDTTIDFTFQSVGDQITLPPAAVIGEHFLSLDPPARTARPGEAVVYDVMFRNLNDIPSNPFFTPPPLTYDISVAGIPDSWHIFPDSFQIGGKSTTRQFRVEADPLATPGDYTFTITATHDGVSDSVQGRLTLAGDVFTPYADARGISGSIQPASLSVGRGNAAVYDIEVINTGVSEETLTLEIDSFNLPPGTTAIFSQDTLVIPPGPDSRRELTLTVVPPVGSAPDRYFLSVFAQSADFELFVDLSTEMIVLEQGVEVAITPTTGSPASTFDLAVTNTGEVTDTFDLSISAPWAILSALGSTFVTLGAGESQTIPITVGASNFTLPGALPLVATATSQTESGVTDSAAAAVETPELRGLFAEFDPDTVLLSQLEPARLALVVNNLGNVEEQFVATIAGTSGPIVASMNGLEDPVSTSAPFIIPPLGSAVLYVDAQLTEATPGTVTVEVTSVNDASRRSEATATLLIADVQFDFGDAPDLIPHPTAPGSSLPGFPTFLDDNGARHAIVDGGPFLGAVRPDAEDDGQPTGDAVGDDAIGEDDEDVAGTDPIILTRGQPLSGISFVHDGGQDGAFLNAWIDLNRDGDWDDESEQFLADVAVPPGASSTSLDGITIPGSATLGTTFVRVRISSDSGLTPRGAAADGEVEDFQVDVVSLGEASIRGRKWNDLNANGTRELDEPWLNDWAVILFDTEGDYLTEQQTHDIDFNNDNEIDPETERGWYLFENLAEGAYAIGEEKRAEWEQTQPTELLNTGLSNVADFGYVVDVVASAASFDIQTAAHLSIVQINEPGGQPLEQAPNGFRINGSTNGGPTTIELSGTGVLNFNGSFATSGTGLATVVDLDSAISATVVPAGVADGFETAVGGIQFINDSQSPIEVTVRVDPLVTAFASITDPALASVTNLFYDVEFSQTIGGNANSPCTGGILLDLQDFNIAAQPDVQVGPLGSPATSTITIPASSTCSYNLLVQAGARAEVDMWPTYDFGNHQDSVVVTPHVADLSLVKLLDNSAAEVGEDVTFTISLSNAGPDAATGVEVLDLLPTGLNFVNAAPSQGSYDEQTGVWLVGSLAATDDATLSLTATVTTSDPITNVAQVSRSDQLDPDSTPGNNVSGEDDQSSATVGECLAVSGVHLDANRLTFSCASPGSISAFVMGTDQGSTYYSQYDVTAQIADAEVVALGVADTNGVAVVHVSIPDELAGQTVYFQAFEIHPGRTLSNTLSVLVPSLDEVGGGEGTPPSGDPPIIDLPPSGIPLLAVGGEAESDDQLTVERIDEANAHDVLREAKARWSRLPLTDAQREDLDRAQLRVVDLPDGTLGSTWNSTIFVDPTGAGYGWFVDATPHDDIEFGWTQSPVQQIAKPPTMAHRMDLLTVLMHELGHVLEQSDENHSPNQAGLMQSVLPTGTRRHAVPRLSLEIDYPLVNKELPADVNRDGRVSLVDLLNVVNHLRQHGSQDVFDLLRSDPLLEVHPIDVTSDNRVSLLDAVAIVHAMRKNFAGGEPDFVAGESTPRVDAGRHHHVVDHVLIHLEIGVPIIGNDHDEPSNRALNRTLMFDSRLDRQNTVEALLKVLHHLRDDRRNSAELPRPELDVTGDSRVTVHDAIATAISLHESFDHRRLGESAGLISPHTAAVDQILADEELWVSPLR